MHIRICRKEAKETRYWLQLVNAGNAEKLHIERESLIRESTKLTMIFDAISKKT